MSHLGTNLIISKIFLEMMFEREKVFHPYWSPLFFKVFQITFLFLLSMKRDTKNEDTKKKKMILESFMSKTVT